MCLSSIWSNETFSLWPHFHMYPYSTTEEKASARYVNDTPGNKRLKQAPSKNESEAASSPELVFCKEKFDTTYIL